MVLATGGTIAGVQADPKAPGYKSGTFSVEDLVDAVPPLRDVATIDGQQVTNIGSQNMDDGVWLNLLKATSQALAKPDVAGVVVTHGTDTMEETAYFLN